MEKRLFLTSLKQTCNEYLYLNINKCKLACLENRKTSPRAPIPNGRMGRIMQPWLAKILYCYRYNGSDKYHICVWLGSLAFDIVDLFYLNF